MNILFTALSLVAFLGCLLAYTRAEKRADGASETEARCNLIAMKLRTERDRVTVVEREVDALRRELRKLSGKFYAEQRMRGDAGDVIEGEEHVHAPVAPFCENYGKAQAEGPFSQAAKCECGYCKEMRARKAAFRDSAVPKTVAAQGELAKLNAAKP